jgi:molybdopterin/thiamine biosynthesis adenylyltransferase
MTTYSIVCLDEHDTALRDVLFARAGVEGAAYVLLKEAVIGSDPWEGTSHTRLLLREVIPIEPVSASDAHVTWDTKSYVQLLQRAQKDGLVLGIAHSHPLGFHQFSIQDDENEAELLRTACNRNGRSAKLVSMLFTADGGIQARVWEYPKHSTPARSVSILGERFDFHSPGGVSPSSEVFARQALAFGPALVGSLGRLRVGVIGAGGTGSATAMLLARLGVGQLVVVDDDIVDVTNLNRLHGATREDADAMRPKAEVVCREIARMAIGTRAVPLRGWVNSSLVRDALKSCDVIFCCTDDHAGRIFLNRLAYFYLVPVIDMGLALGVATPPAKGMSDISARVTTIMPPETCLLCRGAVDLEHAREEDLRRQNPAEYERRKREAYVRGAGNPSPAVVTFTTEIACMAVNELLNRIVSFRKKNLGSEIRRRFLFSEDRATSAKSRPNCPICGASDCWGLGDVDPFLDIVG